jgi:hypothetical protein
MNVDISGIREGDVICLRDKTRHVVNYIDFSNRSGEMRAYITTYTARTDGLGPNSWWFDGSHYLNGRSAALGSDSEADIVGFYKVVKEVTE